VESVAVLSFACGDPNLDRFIMTEEAAAFEEAGLGRSYLVFHDGTLVAYYTLSNDSLRIEYLDAGTSLPRPVEQQVDAFPAVKIGRLAVARDWQNRGIGRHLISMIALEATLQGRRSGVRFLILEAMPESVAFYRKCGFNLTKETRRERGKRNRTMFLDLRPLDPRPP
jgi:GNAT superfamily N-acetyltransferase